jgi:hypothetical protein
MHDTFRGFLFSHLGAFDLATPERILGPVFYPADKATPLSILD